MLKLTCGRVCGLNVSIVGTLLSLSLLAGTEVSTGGEPPMWKFPPAATVEGEPRDCGRAYGKLFRRGIRSFLENEIFNAFLDKPSSKEQLLGYAAACGKVLRAECPLI